METIQDNNLNADNFRNGLLTLLDNFSIINEHEEYQRVEKFRKGFFHLISTVKQAQEKGLWRKTYFNLFKIFIYTNLKTFGGIDIDNIAIRLQDTQKWFHETYSNYPKRKNNNHTVFQVPGHRKNYRINTTLR